MQNITGCHKFCISYEALTKRSFKTHSLLALYIQFSNQTNCKWKNVTTSLFTFIPMNTATCLIPRDLFSTTSTAIGWAQFETTWVIQCPIWFSRGFWPAGFACTIICSHIVTRRCKLKMPIRESTALGPNLKKKKPNQTTETPKTLNSCSTNRQCPYFVLEQDSINVEYFRVI